MLDLHHLRALHTIATTGSISAAATRLHCSQSALSHLIRNLERSLDTSVIDRKQRPIRLTQVGRYLADGAPSILTAMDDLQHGLHERLTERRRRLYICLECHTCIEWLAPAMDAFRQAHPDIDLDLRMGDLFDPLPALEHGDIDLLITAERGAAPGMIADALFTYDVVGVVAQTHPLAHRPHLKPKDFVDQTVITYPVAECRLDLFTRFLDPAGIVPKRRRTAELTAVILQWVASGQGIAALPRWTLVPSRHDLSLLPLGRSGLWADLYALRRESDADHAVIDEFIALSRKHSFANLSGIKPLQ